ncbi:MAG: hypothetical protein K0M48_07265 [Thiobacillus sp.]|nr:hypothetical protein [Thiobacillus sp.]
MDDKSAIATLEPFRDEYGRDYKRGWRGCSSGEALLHACAVALNTAYEYYSDPYDGQQHPLEDLAGLTEAIARNNLSYTIAQAFSVFISHAWKLEEKQLLMLASWSRSLANAAQERRPV